MYPAYFIDTIRLQQDLEAEQEVGSAFLAEPGLIILAEVTREAMENVVRQLWEQGYFKFLVPLKIEIEEIKEKTRAVVKTNFCFYLN